MDSLQNKTLRRNPERNEESCETSEPPVVVPVCVVAVDIHIALVIVPAVEGGRTVQNAFHSTTPRMLSGLYRIRHRNALAFCTK